MDMFHIEDPVELDASIARMRKEPPKEILAAFFPSDRERIKQLMRGFGLYRPTLKTDQGMPGNFTAFQIDSSLDHTDLREQRFIGTEGLAIPEPHYDHTPDQVRSVQEKFAGMKLYDTYTALNGSAIAHRQAEKGRLPYFFIQAAKTDVSRVFGADVVENVSAAVSEVLNEAVERAQSRELDETGDVKAANLVYFQPDVYITPEGKVLVERINCPDVGMFLTRLDVPSSRLLPSIKEVMTGISQQFGKTIQQRFDAEGRVTLLTRDEVILDNQDLLEMGDIEVIKDALGICGIHTDVAGMSDIEKIPTGSKVMLLNIDFDQRQSEELFRRHAKGEIECFPNPYVQKELLHATGLPEAYLTGEYRRIFLEAARGVPSDGKGILNKVRRVRTLLDRCGLDDDILHAHVGPECVPILATSSHSLRQFATRCERYPDEGISLRSIPLNPENSLIDSDTGKRMHVYRFGATVSS